MENIPDMLYVIDTVDLRFMRFNKAGEYLLGYAREEMHGKKDRDLFQKDEAVLFMEKDREVIRNRRILDIPKETIHTKNRGERILHTKKIPVYNRDGKPKYLLGIAKAITEKVQMEEAFRRATKKRAC